MVKHSRISPVSKKRAKEKLTYKKLFEEMDRSAKINSNYVCFFCGKEIYGVANHHHLNGRENSMLNDINNIVLAHNSCHLFYHRATVEQMRKMKWYDEWMNRLRLKDSDSYRREVNKSQKGLLFEE